MCINNYNRQGDCFPNLKLGHNDLTITDLCRYCLFYAVTKKMNVSWPQQPVIWAFVEYLPSTYDHLAALSKDKLRSYLISCSLEFLQWLLKVFHRTRSCSLSLIWSYNMKILTNGFSRFLNLYSDIRPDRGETLWFCAWRMYTV